MHICSADGFRGKMAVCVILAFFHDLHHVPEKEDTKLVTITKSDINRFSNLFTGRLVNKFLVKWLLKTPPYLKGVATLPCEIF